MNQISPAVTLSAQAVEAYQSGDYQSAIRLFDEAAQAFSLEQLPLDAAEMRNNQSVALLQNGDAQAALDVLTGVADTFAQENDIRRQAMTWGNEAAALDVLKRDEEAIAKYRACADAFVEIGEDQLRASVMSALSSLYLRRFKVTEAVWAMWSGLTGLKEPSRRQRVLKSLFNVLKTLFRIRV